MIRHTSRALLLAGILILTGGPLNAAHHIPAMVDGDMLVGPNGMTLYVFDRDSAGHSACNGPCAQNWPPLQAQEGAMADGDYSVITRDDRSQQWAYKGRPLYYWARDRKPGDATGDGFNGVWHVARP